MPEALEALQQGGNAGTRSHGWLVFQPGDRETTVGLIFHPGGRVDPRSYAPTARAIADAGYQVVIVPMPLNLAAMGPSEAQT